MRAGEGSEQKMKEKQTSSSKFCNHTIWDRKSNGALWDWKSRCTTTERTSVHHKIEWTTVHYRTERTVPLHFHLALVLW